MFGFGIPELVRPYFDADDDLPPGEIGVPLATLLLQAFAPVVGTDPNIDVPTAGITITAYAPTLVAASIELRYSGGSANSNPALSLGGAISTIPIAARLFPAVTQTVRATGVDWHSCVYVKVVGTDYNDVRAFVSAETPLSQTTIALGWGAAKNTTETAIPNDETPPVGVVFEEVSNYGDATTGGDFSDGDYRALWIRFTVDAGASLVTLDQFRISVVPEEPAVVVLPPVAELVVAGNAPTVAVTVLVSVPSASLLITPYAPTVAATASATPAVRSESSGMSAAETNTTSHTVTLPATISAGDLILVVFGFDGDPGHTWDDSSEGTWTLLFNQDNNYTINLLAYYKVADGSEDGGTLSITTGLAQLSAWQCFAIQDADEVEAAVAAFGSGNMPNPPAVTPTWGSHECLTFAVACHDNGGRTITGYPSGYSTPVYVQRSPSGDGLGLATGRKVSTYTSEDPSAFTLNDVAWHNAATIAVRKS